jgi:two-component system sensor kinase FixL
MLKDAIVQARNIARGIAPVHMDEAGLSSALDELAGSTRRLHEIDCQFVPEGEVLINQRDMAVHLYRIAQEAISNAVRHGQADIVTIALAIRAPLVILTIRDNGSGIDPDQGPCGGMGLRSMRYRAGVLDGTIEITPATGGGTLVRCTTPLSNRINPDSIHAN